MYIQNGPSPRQSKFIWEDEWAFAENSLLASPHPGDDYILVLPLRADRNTHIRRCLYLRRHRASHFFSGYRGWNSSSNLPYLVLLRKYISQGLWFLNLCSLFLVYVGYEFVLPVYQSPHPLFISWYIIYSSALLGLVLRSSLVLSVQQ